MSVNKQLILGRLGADPEFKTLDNGTALTRIRVATDFRWKDKNSGETQSKTTWHNVVIWRGMAEVISKHFKKGDMIYIEGRTENREYDDKDGNKKYITEVVAENFSFVGGKSEQQSSGGDSATNATPTTEVENDHLPF
jgi:single-strand DNA-binding protein